MENYTNGNMNNGKSFDKEYSCSWLREQQFLTENGIRYTFVKTIDGVTVWKYTKNYKLFSTLAEFYKEVYSK